MARPSVVLPEPEPPTSATTSPGWMASDTWSTAAKLSARRKKAARLE